MTIRRYEASDRNEVLDVWRQVLGYTDPHNKPSLSLDKKLAHDTELLLVAEVDGRVVGTVMGGWDGHRGWIYSLAVLPEYRGRGLGRQLVETIEQRLIAAGAPKINLQVVVGNETAVTFYERLGYRVEPRVSLGKRIQTEPSSGPDK